MKPILSFKLLPNKNFDGIGTYLVRNRRFGGKTLDKYCLLMLSPSVFTVPRKVGLSVQILMTLNN